MRALLLILLATPALAQDPVTADEFERLTEGRVLTYGREVYLAARNAARSLTRTPASGVSPARSSQNPTRPSPPDPSRPSQRGGRPAGAHHIGEGADAGERQDHYGTS